MKHFGRRVMALAALAIVIGVGLIAAAPSMNSDRSIVQAAGLAVGIGALAFIGGLATWLLGVVLGR